MLKIVTLFIAISLINNCPNSDTRCASCNGSRCNVCYDSFTDDKGLCRASSIKVPNCLSYSENGRCKFCNHGYFATATGNCDQILQKDCIEVDR